MGKSGKSIISQIGILSRVIVVVALVALIVNNIYNITLFKKESKSSLRYMLNRFAADVENEFKNTGMLISNISVEYALRLYQADDNLRYFVKNEILNQMEYVTPTMKYVDGYFYSSPVDESFLYCMNPSNRYNIPDSIRNYIKHYKERANNRYNWELMVIDDKPYLFYSNVYNGIYYGAWCEVPQLIQYASVNLPKGTFVYALDGAGKSLLPADSGKKTVGNRAMFPLTSVSVPLPSASSEFYLEMRSSISIYKYIWFSVALISLSGIVIILLLINLIWTQRKMLIPIRVTVEAFNQVKDGDLDTRLTAEDFPREFQNIGQAFNEMVSEIGRLKIAEYTNMIAQKNIELQYYQMQIKPHFYLNIINTIYSMAQIGECGAIQEISGYLSEYMRYMFSNNCAYETIESALNNLKNYIQLQRIRNIRIIECSMDVSLELLECKIPFLLLHTFVENSLKYAKTYENVPLKVSITVKLLEEKQICVIIKDNGQGYPETFLKGMEEESYLEKENKHIGILNVYKRMKLLYPDGSSLKLSNENGALAEIKLLYRI